VPLNAQERALLEKACAAVPSSSVPLPDYPDYVTNLLLTVLDLRLQNVIVNNAIEHYWQNRWNEIRSLAALENVLARFANDRAGNRAAAQYLWGYKYGERVEWLRGLIRWVRDKDLTDQERLRQWAHSSDYKRDFAGQVKNLGPAAYYWLLIRLGVDTVKPDVWLHGFVKRAIGRDLDDLELVHAVTDAAHAVGRRVRDLDAGIWESERGAPGSI
jgi:hypothetical protein